MVEGKEFPSGGLTRFLFLPETSLYTYSSREPRDSPSWAPNIRYLYPPAPPIVPNANAIGLSAGIRKVSISRVRLDRSIFRTSVTLKIRS